MRFDGRRLGLVALSIALVYVALFVWPTPYREYRVSGGDVLVRVNRVTGSKQLIRLWGP